MTDKEHDRLASIIIPCWNQLEFTRLCLAALVRHTRPPRGGVSDLVFGFLLSPSLQ